MSDDLDSGVNSNNGLHHFGNNHNSKNITIGESEGNVDDDVNVSVENENDNNNDGKGHDFAKRDYQVGQKRPFRYYIADHWDKDDEDDDDSNNDNNNNNNDNTNSNNNNFGSKNVSSPCEFSIENFDYYDESHPDNVHPIDEDYFWPKVIISYDCRGEGEEIIEYSLPLRDRDIDTIGNVEVNHVHCENLLDHPELPVFLDFICVNVINGGNI